MLVAVFPLASGGAACLQLQDEGELRRGGVYLLEEDDPERPALAPRFDELFADAASKFRARPALHAPLLDLLREACRVAARTQPRLEPPVLEAIGAVAGQARALGAAHPDLPGLDLEALVMACLLIFVSEEERYPRPRYRGGGMALDRLLEAVGEAP